MSRCMFYTKKVNKDLNTQVEICKALIECKCNNCNFIITKEAYEKNFGDIKYQQQLEF